MNIRQVRTAAVAAGALVLLTGAKHSHGGGCSGHSDGSSSHHVSSSRQTQVKITDCRYSEGRGVIATVRASNRTLSSRTFGVTVDFKSTSGDAIGTRTQKIEVDGHTSTTAHVTVPYRAKSSTEAAATPRCMVAHFDRDAG